MMEKNECTLNPDVTMNELYNLHDNLEKLLEEHGFGIHDDHNDIMNFLLRLQFNVNGEKFLLSTGILEIFLGFHVPDHVFVTGEPIVIEGDPFK